MMQCVIVHVLVKVEVWVKPKATAHNGSPEAGSVVSALTKLQTACR